MSGWVSSCFDPVGKLIQTYRDSQYITRRARFCSLTFHQISSSTKYFVKNFPRPASHLHNPHLFQRSKCSSSLFCFLLPFFSTRTCLIVCLFHKGQALLSLQPVSRSVVSSITYLQLCNIYKQAEKQHHPYIGYDPTGHYGTIPTVEQNHARREATTLPIPIRQLALVRSLLLPDSPLPLARRVQAKWVQNIQNIHKLPQQHPSPIRGPAPIPRPAVFANAHHPRVHTAKVPIQRTPLVAGQLDAPVHDIQKSNRWGPQYHAGVKAPSARPY